MSKHRKQMLRDEWRRSPRLAPRREIGRTPNWVIQKLRERRRRTEEREDG